MQDSRAWRIRSHAENRKVTVLKKKQRSLLSPWLLLVLSPVNQIPPHCALWQLDDNNTHSQWPCSLSFLSHTTLSTFKCLFSAFVFCVTIPDNPKLCFRGGERCVWLCVVMKCWPKESKVPELSGLLHKYKCKMSVQGFFFLCCRVVWTRREILIIAAVAISAHLSVCLFAQHLCSTERWSQACNISYTTCPLAWKKPAQYLSKR